MWLIIIWIIQIMLIPVASPLFIGIVRKIKAVFQNRAGASIFQPYKDLRKLFNKDEIISTDASWIFKFTPYLIFSITIIIGASIPVFSTVFIDNPLSDFLTFVYLIALSTFFIALAGLDVGSAFGGFGSSREMTIAALTEGGLIFSLLALAFEAHSGNFFIISKCNFFHISHFLYTSASGIFSFHNRNAFRDGTISFR
jgi:formate hydrogenlyase subunit 4